MNGTSIDIGNINIMCLTDTDRLHIHFPSSENEERAITGNEEKTITGNEERATTVNESATTGNESATTGNERAME